MRFLERLLGALGWFFAVAGVLHTLYSFWRGDFNTKTLFVWLGLASLCFLINLPVSIYAIRESIREADERIRQRSNYETAVAVQSLCTDSGLGDSDFLKEAKAVLYPGKIVLIEGEKRTDYLWSNLVHSRTEYGFHYYYKRHEIAFLFVSGFTESGTILKKSPK